MGKYKIARKMRTHTNIDVHALTPVCLLEEKKKIGSPVGKKLRPHMYKTIFTGKYAADMPLQISITVFSGKSGERSKTDTCM